MKKLCFTLLLGTILGGLAGVHAQEASGTFTLKGDASKVNQPVDWVYLMYATGGERKTDSTRLLAGKYSFSGEVAEPVMARLVTYRMAEGNKKMPVYKSLFLEPGVITVTHEEEFINLQVSGSPANTEYEALNDQLKPINSRREELIKEYNQLSKDGDEEEKKEIVKKIEAIGEEVKEEYGSYVKRNPESSIALFALSQFAGWDIDPVKVEPLLQLLPDDKKEWPTAKSLAEKVAIAKKTAVGSYAMNFTQDDTLGKPVSLSAFKGKYVLIDFWASWCGPCRAENPNVVKVFNKYQEKGFHIIGISLDRPEAKDKWVKAIHDDNLTWTHVSDLKFWNNEVARQYGIQAIPQNLLLDPTGKIIAKNLRGEDLDKKLGEVFN